METSENFSLCFGISICYQGRVTPLLFSSSREQRAHWWDMYGIIPRKQFDFYGNEPGGLILKVNGKEVISADNYENFVISFAYGWKLLLNEKAGEFATGEPGFSVSFNDEGMGRMLLEIINLGSDAPIKFIFKADDFRRQLASAYAGVAEWVRAADPAYYDELLKNGTLPVPAPDPR